MKKSFDLQLQEANIRSLFMFLLQNFTMMDLSPVDLPPSRWTVKILSVAIFTSKFFLGKSRTMIEVISLLVFTSRNNNGITTFVTFLFFILVLEFLDVTFQTNNFVL